MWRRLVVAIVTVFAGVASAEQLRVGPLMATFEAAHSYAQDGAFVPVWVDVVNESGSSRELTLEFHTYRSPRTSATRTVTVEGRERTTVMLPIPATAGGGALELRSGLLRAETTLSIGAYPAALLVVGSPAKLTAETQWDESAGTTPATFLDVERVPSDLSMLAGWRAVLLLEDVAGLSNAQRAALEAYVRTGGELRVAPGVATVALSRWSGEVTQGETLGFGSVRRCAGAACLDLSPRVEDAASVEGTDPYADLLASSDGDLEHTLMPDIGRAPIPVFLLLIVLFALAIGPGNFLVARRFGRHLVLVTTPLLAFTTCGGIATFGVLSEGLFTVHGAVRGVTLLDTSAHEATTVGVSAYYASLAPDALRYPAQTAVAFTKKLSGATVDASNGLALHGVVPSRSYAEVHLHTVHPTRARVGIEGESLENALGARIRTAWVRRGREVLVYEGIGDGERGTVSARRTFDEPLSLDACGDLRGWRLTVFARPFLCGVQLQEGEFLALLDGAAFVPQGGLAVEWQPTFEAVRGRVER